MRLALLLGVFLAACGPAGEFVTGDEEITVASIPTMSEHELLELAHDILDDTDHFFAPDVIGHAATRVHKLRQQSRYRVEDGASSSTSTGANGTRVIGCTPVRYAYDEELTSLSLALYEAYRAEGSADPRLLFYEAELRYALKDWESANRLYERVLDEAPETWFARDAAHAAALIWYRGIPQDERTTLAERWPATWRTHGGTPHAVGAALGLHPLAASYIDSRMKP